MYVCFVSLTLKNKIMKRFTLLSLLIAASFTLTSCDAITGIFEAGFNVGVFVVIAVIALVLILLFRGFGGKK